MAKSGDKKPKTNSFMLLEKGPKWKREQVSDHKFDYIDVDEFYDPSCWTKMKYMTIFFSVIKSTLTYLADLWTAGILLISVDPQVIYKISPTASKWIYVGCIVLSFLLLALDIRKARLVIASRDISYALTSITAYRYYSIKSYPHYCLFDKIQSSKKSTDGFAFFVFFTLKGWKRLLFAEGPRQVVAIITVENILYSAWTKNGYFQFNTNWEEYGSSTTTRMQLILMTFTSLLWAFSMIMMFIAAIIYVPLLCHIKGNLKEYVCHKIDKRQKQIRKRMEQRDKKKVGGGQGTAMPAPRPTLPIVDESVISEKPNYANDYMASPYSNTKSPPPVYHTPYSEYNSSPYQYEDQYYAPEGGYHNDAYNNQYAHDVRLNERYARNDELYYDDRSYYGHNQGGQHATGEAYAMTTYHETPKFAPSPAPTPAPAPVIYNEVPAPQAYTTDNHLYYEPNDVRARSLADSSNYPPSPHSVSTATPAVPNARLPRNAGNYF
ncbi:hypothetical protein INT43_001245 [Umbelopsis isabellina]|uniref:Uncharacterized protein n=1 Tax=Mortierella isabellina TaxID=91625 RepID=A0A8H7UD68_MORIS|nr:hypothetical protein INT43_001245 [Umbelopsis isabellina]